MMDASVLPELPNPATVTARFPEHVTAKLATEKLVRDAPADRRCDVLSSKDDRVMLEVISSKSELAWVTEILRRDVDELSP
jgi:hypothetical protein